MLLTLYGTCSCYNCVNVCLCTCIYICADIAISAPYVDHGDAEGTVYVYLGSGDDVISREPDEVSSKISRDILW